MMIGLLHNATRSLLLDDDHLIWTSLYLSNLVFDGQLSPDHTE